MCLDLSVISDAPPGIEEKSTCSCHWGCVLLEDGGRRWFDTRSPISCGSLSVNRSDAQPSAELFAGDNIWVHYDSGHAYNQTKIVDGFQGRLH